MRAVVYTQAGDPDVLRLVDRPLPQPGPGEVRVRMSVSGVNPTDWKARRGTVAGEPGDPAAVPIQLARWAGARVIATVSGDEKAKLAQSAGAHHTVNYRVPAAADEILRLAPDGIDVIVEVAPAANATLDAAVLAPDGTVAAYATD